MAVLKQKPWLVLRWLWSRKKHVDFCKYILFIVFWDEKTCSSGYEGRTRDSFEIWIHDYQTTPRHSHLNTHCSEKVTSHAVTGFSFLRMQTRTRDSNAAASRVSQYITTQTRACALEQRSGLSAEHATACQTHIRGKDACVADSTSLPTPLFTCRL